jgi:hypothetical protein
VVAELTRQRMQQRQRFAEGAASCDALRRFCCRPERLDGYAAVRADTSQTVARAMKVRTEKTKELMAAVGRLRNKLKQHEQLAGGRRPAELRRYWESLPRFHNRHHEPPELDARQLAADGSYMTRAQLETALSGCQQEVGASMPSFAH